MGLLDRLRGDRSLRGYGCDDGCDSPCSNSGCSGCSDCGGGAVQYDNYDGNMYNATPTQAAPIMAVPESTEGSVIVPVAEGANYSPNVNPNAFVIRSK